MLLRPTLFRTPAPSNTQALIHAQGVDIDRRMLDFLVGLDTEFSDMVDGSHLYFPSYVRLADVVLPAEQKQVRNTVRDMYM